ncbi:MAG: hypothetical protein ACO1RT_20515 [Planctomycetaceae bacterium]
MTFIKHFALATMVAGLSAGLAAPSYAFMADADAAASVDGVATMTQAVEAIRQELTAGKTTCNDLLAKIDKAIEQIDAALDKGVAEEQQYLGLRDELVELRLALPCVANELAGEVIVDDTIIAESVIAVPGPMVADGGHDHHGGLVGPGYGGSSSGGGYSMGSGGGGSSGAVGGSGGLLALGAIGTAVALGVTDDDDDTPGENPSPSE